MKLPLIHPKTGEGAGLSRAASDSSASGVTMVEFLVAVALVAILAALLVPVVSRVGKRSLQASDLNNLRHLGVASEQFIQEHRNYLPIGLDRSNFFGRNASATRRWSWMEMLGPYLLPGKNQGLQVGGLVSPADPSKGGAARLGPNKTHRSYGMNSRTEWGELPLNKLHITQPARFLTMGNYDIELAGDSANINGGFTGGSHSMDRIPVDWYANGSANFLFLDGHVESIPVQLILPGSERYYLFNRELNRPENRWKPESGF